MTDEEQAAVQAENEERNPETASAEQSGQTDAADNFGVSPEDNFAGGFEDNFGLGDSLLSNGTLPTPPPAPKKKAPAPPVTPRNREETQPRTSVLPTDPSSLSAAASAPSPADHDGEPVISVNAAGAKPKAASGGSGIISVNTAPAPANVSVAASRDVLSVSSDEEEHKPTREEDLFDRFQLMHVPPTVCKYVDRFRPYLAQHPDALKELEPLLCDEASVETVRLGMKRLEAFPTSEFVDMMFYRPIGMSTESERRDWDAHLKRFSEYAELAKGEYPYFDPSQFFYRHGAIYLDSAVTDRLAGGIFYQCGAFCGASVIVMNLYKPEKIYAFEPANGTSPFLQTNIVRSGLADKVDLYQLFIADRTGKAIIPDRDKDGNPCKTEARVAPLDLFAQKKSIPGRAAWIQGDVSGMGLHMIRGAEQMIKRDKPLITVAIHHSPDEFFGIAPLLHEWAPEYKLMVRRCQCNLTTPYSGITLIAYVP